VPTRIDLPELRRLIADGAQLVEVLPAGNYDAAHLPGAINIPLRGLDARSASRLDQTRPIVVYCHDGL
jgi:phage shock protein E